jgi:hypothetical protein
MNVPASDRSAATAVLVVFEATPAGRSAAAAQPDDAGVIVLADHHRGPLRRRLFPDPVERLRAQGRWDVVVVTAADRRSGGSSVE